MVMLKKWSSIVFCVLIGTICNRGNTVTIENGIEFFLPVEEQPLSNLEIQAITALTGTAPQLAGTACWAIVRHEVFIHFFTRDVVAVQAW